MTRRKDGRWQYYKVIGDKRIYFYSSEKTERAAARDIENQIFNYSTKAEKGKTFKEVADMWERDHYPKIEYQTALRYKSLTAHAVKWFGNSYVKEITPKDVEAFLSSFVQKKYSTKSIKDQLSVLSMIFKFAYINKYIETVPTQFITPPKGKKAEKRQALTNEQITTVKKSIDCTMGLFAFFLLYTGLRKGEALALQYKDINRTKKTITVNKTLYFEGNNPVIKHSTKTIAGERQTILPDALAKVLPKGQKNDIIFNVNGEYYKNSLFTRQFDKYKKETGLKITPHQLRHAHATILYEAKVDAKTAQYLLGHADITTTQNIYTHIRQSKIDTTVLQLNEYLNNIK